MAGNNGTPKGSFKWQDPKGGPKEEYVNLRGHERHELSIALDVYSGHLCLKSKAYLKDISLEGAGFWSKDEIGLETPIKFNIEGMGLSGNVIRKGDAPYGMYGWGIKFDGIGILGRFKLGKIIKKLMRENKLTRSEDNISETIMKKSDQ